MCVCVCVCVIGQKGIGWLGKSLLFMDCANTHHNTQLSYQEKTDKTSYRLVGLISATMQVAPGKGHNGVIIIMPNWAHYLENQINTSLSLSLST